MPALSITLLVVSIAIGIIICMFVWLPARNVFIPLYVRNRMILDNLKPEPAAAKCRQLRTIWLWIGIALGVLCSALLVINQWLG